MAIGYTEIDFVNGSAPALNATNLNKIDEALKDACDELDALGVVATLDAKTSVADADEALVRDSAASSAVKKITFTTIFAAIWTKLGALIAGGTDKATPLDADTVPLSSAADSAATRKLTWANLKATLKAYFDTLYPALAHATRHQHGGADEIATATPGANVIPKAGADSKLAAGFIPQATESAVGGAELATAAEIVTGTDTGADRTLTPGRLKTALASDGMWLAKRTKMPDGATGVSGGVQDAWADRDGWGVTLLSYSNPSAGIARFTYDSGGYTTKTISGVLGKKFAIRYRNDGLKNLAINIGSGGSTAIAILPPTTFFSTIVMQIPASASSETIMMLIPSGGAGNWFEIDWLWIGDYSYLTGTLSEEAARIADQLGDSPGVGQAAYATLTSTGTAPSDGDTVTIGGKVYTFKTTLGTTEGQVLIGDTANAAAALDNLKSAINSTGVSAVHYCAAQHPLVEATTNTDTTQVVAARTTGALGNAITIAESSSQLSWANPDGGTTVLSQGYSDAASKIIGEIQYNIAGSKTRPAAAQVHLTDNTKIGYETTVDVAKDATFTLPAGGTWIWNVYGYGATISSAKRGSSAGGTTLTVAGANASVGYRRYA